MNYRYHLLYNGRSYCCATVEKEIRFKVNVVCEQSSLKSSRDARKTLYRILSGKDLSEKEIKIQIALGVLPKIEVVKGRCPGAIYEQENDV